MSNSRFSLTNLLASATCKNGSGGSAPALDETTGYETSRAQNSDRYSLWKTSGGGGTYNVDFDLGSAQSVRVGALLGLSCLTAVGGTLTLQYANSYYPGAWTTAGTATWAAGDRDVGVVLNSAAVSDRYWRFNIVAASAVNITLGRLFLGTWANYELIGMHSPGGTSSPYQNRVEQALADGSFNINTLGFPGRDFTLPFNQVTSTDRDILTTVAAATGSVVFIDGEDDVYEVLVTGGRADVARRSGTTFDTGVTMKRLP